MEVVEGGEKHDQNILHEKIFNLKDYKSLLWHNKGFSGVRREQNWRRFI